MCSGFMVRLPDFISAQKVDWLLRNALKCTGTRRTAVSAATITRWQWYYAKGYMPQAIMATTAMTKPADSQHMKDRSRSDMARGYASAAALQLGREIDPRYLRPEAATVLQAGAYYPCRSKAGMRRPRQSVRQFPNRRHP